MLTALLAAKSLRNRLLTTLLTLSSIALSVALLVGVENVRAGMRESFSSTISQTDLIVGARGGTIQLLLYSVFGIGSPTNNIAWETYEQIREHPAVAWTIPYSLGDSHRGYRVIGTTDDFYEHYRYREDRQVELTVGRVARNEREVVVGSEVARQLGYSPGDRIVLAHGLGPMSFLEHDQNPFEVVGVIRETFTPVDRALYVTLEGIEAMHEGWESGAPPMDAFGALGGPGGMGLPGAPPPLPGATQAPEPAATGPAAGAAQHSHEHVHGDALPSSAGAADGAHDHEISAITYFFVGTRSRTDALRLQRDINTWEGEPIMAILPGVALAEMWRSVGYAEDALKVVTAFVVLVGLLGMIVSLYTSLNERRREMAILRAIGARRTRIVSLLVLESGLLAVLGSIAGVGLVYFLLLVGQGPVEQHFGLHVPIRPLGQTEITYVAVVIGAGFLLGLIPALKAYRNALVDGLSIRV
jgi:putative ABC transport system permease protein